jgi:hypothetical protein
LPAFRAISKYLRVSADLIAKPAAHARGKPSFSTLESDCGERRTVRWRETDSNFQFRRERTGFRASGLLLARDRGVGADVSVQPGCDHAEPGLVKVEIVILAGEVHQHPGLSNLFVAGTQLDADGRWERHDRIPRSLPRPPAGGGLLSFAATRR